MRGNQGKRREWGGRAVKGKNYKKLVMLFSKEHLSDYGFSQLDRLEIEANNSKDIIKRPAVRMCTAF